MNDSVTLFNLSEMAREQIAPGVMRRYAVGQAMTFAIFEYEVGAKAPLHKHAHEQLSIFIEGRARATVGDRTFDVGPGDAVLVPANMPHAFEALTEVLEYDFFSPARMDWVRGEAGNFMPR